MSMKGLIYYTPLLLIGGCSPSSNASQSATVNATAAPDPAVMRGQRSVSLGMMAGNWDDEHLAIAQNAEDRVKATLKDPGSARFKDVVASKSMNCAQGSVTAKNGFGGYGDEKSFVVIDGRAQTQDDGVEAMQAGLKCVNASTPEMAH